MFTIKYTVWNVDSLNELQRSRYERWQAIVRDELIRKYGRIPRGATLNMETHREMLAREAYEDSLLEDHDRLVMRVGHYIESYFRQLSDKVNCASVYEIEPLRGLEDEMLTSDDKFFRCYLKEREAIVRVSGNKLAVIQSFCDLRYLSYDDQPF